ncbi:MAG: hypothetical protein R3C40_07775 [Parvularculaceae bacterium]
MLTEKTIDAAQQELAELDNRRAQNQRAGAPREVCADEAWARKNLRWRDGRPLTDYANCLRVLEQHEDFQGRFKYNEVINRVLDKGTVMLDWRMTELTAAIQERFIPEISIDVVSRSLVTAANRAGK